MNQPKPLETPQYILLNKENHPQLIKELIDKKLLTPSKQYSIQRSVDVFTSKSIKPGWPSTTWIIQLDNGAYQRLNHSQFFNSFRLIDEWRNTQIDKLI